jgi:NAD(P)-dependent dehydrogenase (short-subunit alcohol dehydrogenase family)
VLELIAVHNNAAVFVEGPGQNGLPSIRELMASTYNTNVFGTAVLTDAALPLLEKSDFPRIINVTSSLDSAGFMSNDQSPFYHAQAVVSPQRCFVCELPLTTLQVYNTSKNAVNGLAVHHGCLLHQKCKKTQYRAASLCPGYCATGLNNYSGYQDPAEGATGVVNAIQHGPDSDWKAIEFRNHEGKPVPW